MKLYKIIKQYHSNPTYGLTNKISALERQGREIIRITRINKDGDALIRTKKGNRKKTFRVDFAGAEIK